jgi:hypothetical protein
LTNIKESCKKFYDKLKESYSSLPATACDNAVRKSEKVSVDVASLGIRLFLTKFPHANLSNLEEKFIIIFKN